ncbi:DUF6284 family protein [Candidatus Frankia nodulisporulans]|uniref:DUF6284 family protein n=1 Tax=Candidatus Frankia nodulisporulans TaxID=2060052 RepID=UPI001CDC8A89|nr:DUF6284 family protein [Candidatus Frankia nodulisporulans]
MADLVEREPTARELAAIDREWPLIAADLAVLDAEITILTADGEVTDLAWRRLAHAHTQALTARPLPAAPRSAGSPERRCTAMATLNPDHLRRVGRALDGALWLVALLVGAYSLANVHTVAVGHHTADPQAWLLAPIVDIALFVAITADSVLARHGLPPTPWGTGLRWFCGLATWTLNVWDAAASLDAGAIVAHSVPPVVLILLAEAAPRYRHQFATLTAPPADAPASTTPPAEAASAPPAGTPAADPTTTVPVPVPRTSTSARRRTGTASKPRAPRRTDAELIAALAEVPRDPDGTIPVRRATAALGCGPDRARRLLTAQGLLRPRITDTTPAPVLTAV